MVTVFRFPMDRPNTKGFTLIESLFVLSIIICMAMISIPVFRKPDLDFSFKSVIDIYSKQCDAMINKEITEYDEGITFNSFGNINHAGTICHEHYDLVFQLGCGRFYVRKAS